MSDYNAKNYHAQGAEEFHIGGKIVLEPGADISELVKASETINDYFFPLHLGDKYSGQNITVQRTSGEGGTEKTEQDQDWVLRLTDGSATVFTFKIQEEETPFLTLSFSEATLKPKEEE